MKIHFKIILAIVLICASSQINAEPIDEKEVAERMVQIAEDMYYIIEHIQNIFVMNREWDYTIKQIKYIYKILTSSKQILINTITNKLGNCTDIPKAAHSFSTFDLQKLGQITRKELWNYIKIPNDFLESLVGNKFKESENKFMIKELLINGLKSLLDNHLKDMGNRIWYILLLVNLLKIKCYSKDTTLKELWHKIPEPSTVPEFGNFTLEELWSKQTLPPLSLYKPTEQFSISKYQGETIEEVWDKINYQLLFLRICQLKFQSKDGIIDRWNEIIPTHIFKHRCVAVRELWNELTQPKIVPESANETLKELWNKLYTPLQSQMELQFLSFTDFNYFGKFSTHQDFNFDLYKRKKYMEYYELHRREEYTRDFKLYIREKIMEDFEPHMRKKYMDDLESDKEFQLIGVPLSPVAEEFEED